MIMKKILGFTLLFLFQQHLFSQSVGIGTTTPHASSLLDLTTTNKGLLLPRVADTSAIANPAKGLIVFTNNTNKLWYHDGTRWKPGYSTVSEDSIWYKVNDSVVITTKRFVGINADYNILNPQANFQVKGSFLVQDDLRYTKADPTVAQTFTMNNTASVQIVPRADSVFFVSDPGGAGNYGNNMQGNVFANAGTDQVASKISSIAGQFSIGSGDTLWISQHSLPLCRTEYFKRYTNTSVNPPDFIYNRNYVHFTFRSDNDGNMGAGFKFKITKLYKNEPLTNIETGGSSLSFNSGNGSLSSGINNIVANGGNAIGAFSEATGFRSVAAGYSNIASGDYSLAMGSDTRASGIAAFSAGANNLAAGYRSTALGYNNEATGGSSLATGYYTNANGSTSSSFGWGTRAEGKSSVTTGEHTIAKGFASLVSGIYNDTILLTNETTPTPGTPLFIVGNGSSHITRSNAMVVLNNGNVGIGKNAPEEALHVEGNAILNNPTGTATFQLQSAGVEKGFVQLSGNNLRLGTYSTNNTGNVIFRLDGGDRFTIFPSGNATLTGVLTQNSDVRLKSNIMPIRHAMNSLMLINGYNYFWQNKNMDSTMQTGVLAQELQKVFPELVKEDAAGTLSVNYSGLIPYVIQAAKEQQAEIEALKTRLLKIEKLLSKVKPD